VKNEKYHCILYQIKNKVQFIHAVTIRGKTPAVLLVGRFYRQSDM